MPTHLSLRTLLKPAGILWICLLIGCTPHSGKARGESGQGGEVLIIYSGNALGELKPCGCDKEEDQGGIERRMGYLKQVRAREPGAILVDVGDNFKEPTRQGRLKAQTMMKALAAMKYDAIVPGDKDLVYGNGLLKGFQDLPWVSANMTLEGIQFTPYRIRGNVLILAVADPDLFYASSDSNIRLSNPREALDRTLQEARQQHAFRLVVLLTHMKRDQAMAYLDVPGVDVVINGHIEADTDVIDMKPVERNGKIFVQAGPLGQKMGELTVRFQPDQPPSFQHQMVRLGSKAPMDPEMTALYDAYNAEVEEMFMASLAAKRKKKESQVYATEQACRTCHAEDHATWGKSGHSRAYAALKEVNKSFDPECLICHTTGFGKPGGFISELDTPELTNVQCEMCHEARLDHSRNPRGGFAAQARKACARCHVKKHSPKFQFDHYWPRIRH